MSLQPAFVRAVPRLHVITDTSLQTRFDHATLARLAAIGGADAIQIRDKQATDAELSAGVLSALHALAAHGSNAALLIDDRVDLVRQTKAHGVHVGPEDAPPAVARAVLGPDAWIGATVNDVGMLRALRGAPIDYIGVGPVFPTASKGARVKPVLGLDGLAALAAASPWPVIAIGGIRLDTVDDLLAAGAWGVAVIGAVCCQPDPAAATAAIRARIDRVSG